MSESRRPAGSAGDTADTCGSERMRAARAVAWREPAGAPTTTSSGDVRPGGKSLRSAASTRYELALVGSMLALAGRNLIDVNGTPSAISPAAVTTAILPGRAITNRDSRYQKPVSAGRASRSAARWSHPG